MEISSKRRCVHAEILRLACRCRISSRYRSAAWSDLCRGVAATNSMLARLRLPDPVPQGEDPLTLSDVFESVKQPDFFEASRGAKLSR